MATALRQRGFDRFVVLERASDVGGTWRDNTFPGLSCDIPARLYSLSFAPNAEWRRTFAPQREIHEYLRRCATRERLCPHIRLQREGTAADWGPGRRASGLGGGPGPRPRRRVHPDRADGALRPPAWCPPPASTAPPRSRRSPGSGPSRA